MQVNSLSPERNDNVHIVKIEQNVAEKKSQTFKINRIITIVKNIIKWFFYSDSKELENRECVFPKIFTEIPIAKQILETLSFSDLKRVAFMSKNLANKLAAKAIDFYVEQAEEMGYKKKVESCSKQPELFFQTATDIQDFFLKEIQEIGQSRSIDYISKNKICRGNIEQVVERTWKISKELGYQGGSFRESVEYLIENIKSSFPSQFNFLNEAILLDNYMPFNIDEYVNNIINNAINDIISDLFMVDQKKRSCMVALRIAICNKLENFLLVLINSGIDIHATDEIGQTSLHLAAFNGLTECINPLITAGAKVDAVDNDGRTPLHLAALNGRTECINPLITAGAKVNATDNDGMTPLHWAASQGHIDAVEALIGAGAKIDAIDKDGFTSLHLATAGGYMACVNRLI